MNRLNPTPDPRQQPSPQAGDSLEGLGLAHSPIQEIALSYGKGPTQAVSCALGVPLVVYPELQQPARSAKMDLQYEKLLVRLAHEATNAFLFVSEDVSVANFACVAVQNGMLLGKHAAAKYVDQGMSADLAVRQAFDAARHDFHEQPDAEQAVRNREADQLVQDYPGYRNFLLIALERLRQRIPEGSEEAQKLMQHTGLPPLQHICAAVPEVPLTPAEQALFEQSPLGNPAEVHPNAVRLATAVFPDYFETRIGNDAVLLASPALPPFVILFFGQRRVAGIWVPTAERAQRGHLLNMITAAQLPAVVGSTDPAASASDHEWAAMARNTLKGRYGIIAIGENEGEKTSCKMFLSPDAAMLEDRRQGVIRVQRPIVFPQKSSFLTKDGNGYRLGYEVSSIKLARKVKDSKGPVDIVKSEFLLHEFAEDAGKSVWQLTEHDLYKGYLEFLELLFPRQVTLRLFDYASDKYPAPPGWDRDAFTNRQLKQIVRAYLQLYNSGDAGSEPFSVMIPDLASTAQFDHVRNNVDSLLQLRRHHPDLVGVVPQVESEQAIEVMETLLQQQKRVAAIAVGMGDFSSSIMHLPRSSPELQVPEAKVLYALQLLKSLADRHGVDLRLCGDVVGRPGLLLLFEALGIRSLALAPSDVLRVSNLIEKIDRNSAGKCLPEVWYRSTVAARAQVLRRAWTGLGVEHSELFLPGTA